MRARYLAILLATQIPAAARADVPQSPLAESRLDALAAFFFQEKAFAGLITQSCRVAYRTKLTTAPADVALEKTIPGITDQMVSAAGDYCDAQVPVKVREQRDRIKSDWRASADSPQLIRFVDLFRTETDHAGAMNVTIREGEMATDAVARLSLVSATEERAFQAKQAAFAKTPGGAAFLTRVSNYQRRLQADQEGDGWAVALLKTAMIRGAQAANRYATAKGYTEPYPGN